MKDRIVRGNARCALFAAAALGISVSFWQAFRIHWAVGWMSMDGILTN